MAEPEFGTIFVKSEYALRGRAANPFWVRIDGASVGTVSPEGSWAFRVSPGNHQVQVRMWWYRSRPLEVVVAPNTQRVLRANVNGKINSPFLFIRGLFAPWTALRLDQVS